MFKSLLVKAGVIEAEANTEVQDPVVADPKLTDALGCSPAVLPVVMPDVVVGDITQHPDYLKTLQVQSGVLESKLTGQTDSKPGVEFLLMVDKMGRICNPAERFSVALDVTNLDADKAFVFLKATKINLVQAGEEVRQELNRTCTSHISPYAEHVARLEKDREVLLAQLSELNNSIDSNKRTMIEHAADGMLFTEATTIAETVWNKKIDEALAYIQPKPPEPVK